MKLLSLFSGIGAFEKALDNIGVSYDLVNYCEIDKFASKSYSVIHNVPESLNLGDITKCAPPQQNIDLLTYGFPCQDISIAGKQKGFFDSDDSLTRSGLFFHALRIIQATKPRVAIAENVKNLTSKKFSEQFNIVLKSLDDSGYNSYYKVLNAKGFGIPQNRERVFIVSIRKDVDDMSFKFPTERPLELRLIDLLDYNVPEEFYLTDEQIKRLSGNIFAQANTRLQKKDYCDTLLARDYKDPKCVQAVELYGTEKEPNPQAGRIYDSYGISATLDTCSGGNRMPKILVREATKCGFAVAEYGDLINLNYPASTTRRGRVGKKAAQTITTSPTIIVVLNRLRKLTPKECWRLMGFVDEDYEKAEKVCSKTQLYKQAGNSICVPVIKAILINLIDCGALSNEP